MGALEAVCISYFFNYFLYLESTTASDPNQLLKFDPARKGKFIYITHLICKDNSVQSSALTALYIKQKVKVKSI